MPAKVSLYNLKGEVTFDFGTGPRNEVYYNPFGNNILPHLSVIYSIREIIDFSILP